MKLSMLLFDYLTDDVCFEFASLWRRHDGNMSFNFDQTKIVKHCFMTLTSVALTSKNIDVPNDLKSKSTLEIYNDFFNVGTENQGRPYLLMMCTPSNN